MTERMERAARDHDPSSARQPAGAARPRPVPATRTSQLTPEALIDLQRCAGNGAVSRLAAGESPGARDPVVQRSDKPATLDAAIRGGDSSDLDGFRPFRGITSGQLLSIVNIITTEVYVSGREEHILEEAWTSLGMEQALAATDYSLWKSCEKRGANPDNVPWLKSLKAGFATDVSALTRQHLTDNKKLVTDEMTRFGLPTAAGQPASPPTQAQQDEMNSMREAAGAIADIQEEQERARDVYVGYRRDYPPPEGKEAWVPATFDPFNPPERQDAPPRPDPNDPSPMKDRTPVTAVVPTRPFSELLGAYQAGTASIRAIADFYPMIYAISRQGQSSATRAFADASDPTVSRSTLATALQQLVTDIDKASGMLGGKLDPLDLRPVHRQLFDGTKAPGAVGDWSKRFAVDLAGEVVHGHDMDRALVALGLETLAQAAFMLGGVAPGVGGLAVVGLGLAAMGVKASMSDAQYQAMSTAQKTAVGPNTDLVDAGDVSRAKAVRDADQHALALGMVNAAAAVAGALASGTQKLTSIGRRIQAGQRPAPGDDDGPPTTRRPGGGGGGGSGGGGGPAVLEDLSTPERYFVRDSSNPRLQAVGVIEGDGELSVQIRAVLEDGTRSTVLSGGQQFARMVAFFGPRISGIRGSWSYGTNLGTVNELTGQGMPLEQAVAKTWTAEQSAAAGYRNVRVVRSYGDPGSYSKVEVLFTK